MSKLYKLHAPLGSEFSCPDMEMIPPKTAGNLGLRAGITLKILNSRALPLRSESSSLVAELIPLKMAKIFWIVFDRQSASDSNQHLNKGSRYN